MLFVKPRALAGFASAVPIAVGTLALSGWLLDIAALKSVLPGRAPMRANTALAFVLAGVALWLLRREEAGPKTRRLGLGCAAVVAAFGLLTLLEYLFHLGLGLDQWLVRDPTGSMQTPRPGRMAVITALNFTLLGLALLLLDVPAPKGRWLAQLLTVTALLGSLLVLVGYLYQVNELYPVGRYASRALYLAATFLVLALGILLARPDRGPVWVLQSDTTGGMLARRLIPAVVGVPLVLGWLRLLGQQAGLYNTAFGTAVFAITSIAILTAIVLWSAGFLIRADEQRRRAEAILREAHALMQTITNNATTSIFMADRQDRCTFLNPAAETMTGYTFQEIDGRVLHDVIHHQRPDGRPFPLSECAIGQSVLQLKELRGHEDVFVRKDGTFFPVLLNASPIMKDGVLTDIFLEVRDITEEKRAAEALQEADRRKDEFLAMLAHELRNPLAPIRTGLHILRMPQANGAAVDQIKDMMEQQVHHLTRLVDDLLDVSRITRGKIELRKETVELAAAVGHAVETVRSLLDSHHHTLTVALPPAAVHLEADPTRLEQILVNLLNNAAKYTGHGGSISLTAEPDNDQVVIRVRDTGVGLSADLLPKVFDLFTQAERTLDRSQGGLGIGLTLVRRLVEMHGGSVEAHSAGPGQGSEFVVRLPALPKPPEESEVPPEQMARRNDSLRVLVVEDVVEVAHTLKVLLELWGHAVRVVHDGPAALVASRIYQPEVVLLDIGLPGMNGYDVARQLRRQQGRKRPLLVAVTGYGGEEDKRRAREAGFDCHMTKPVDLEELEALIASSSPLATA